MNQFDFDFTNEAAALEAQLQQQWDRNRAAQAHQWTPDAMAMVWAKHDSESWANLPNYTRQQILTDYQFEQDHAAAIGSRTIRDYATVRALLTPCPVVVAQDQERAKRMADRLAADWSANRPPSEFTCQPHIAAMVSRLLGRPVEVVPMENFITIK